MPMHDWTRIATRACFTTFTVPLVAGQIKRTR